MGTNIEVCSSFWPNKKKPIERHKIIKMVGMDGKGVVNPEGRDVVIKRLSEIVSMCETMDDLDDSRDLGTDNAAMGLAKLQEMNLSLSSQLRKAEEAMRSAEVSSRFRGSDCMLLPFVWHPQMRGSGPCILIGKQNAYALICSMSRRLN